uniref:Putative secreted protein n=1 Tax=Anopheles marajoara TaxID=58244 RepID=A0A2M4C6W3_9DIPT
MIIFCSLFPDIFKVLALSLAAPLLVLAMERASKRERENHDDTTTSAPRRATTFDVTIRGTKCVSTHSSSEPHNNQSSWIGGGRFFPRNSMLFWSVLVTQPKSGNTDVTHTRGHTHTHHSWFRGNTFADSTPRSTDFKA